MQLLEELASGINGAGNGSVDIYIRGTSTRAQYFTAFDGSGATTPTASIPLNSQGAIVLYVNQYVDCVVKDSLGNTLKTFTVMNASSGEEVISQSFTGTNYSTGATGASLPIALQAVLDLWKTQNGAPDWKTLVNGVIGTIPTFLGGLVGMFFNVKNPTYGAKGDNSTDDTTAIQSAINAAGAAGGGIVFFPPGTYVITSTLGAGTNVSFMGSGPAGSVITINHATNGVFTFSLSANPDPRFIIGLGLQAKQANTGNLIALQGGAYHHLVFLACHLGNSNTKVPIDVTGETASRTTILGSTLEIGNSTGNLIKSSSATVRCIGCVFLPPTGAYTGTMVNCTSDSGSVLVACRFENGLITSGASFLFNVPINMYACEIPAPGGTGTIGSSGTPATGGRYDAGNFFDDSIQGLVDMASVPAAATHKGTWSITRESARSFLASDAANINVFPDQFGLAEVKRSNSNAQTLTASAPTYGNGHFTLVLNNGTVGTGTTITLSGFKGITTATVNANKVSYFFFKVVEVNANLYLSLVGSDQNEAP